MTGKSKQQKRARQGRSRKIKLARSNGFTVTRPLLPSLFRGKMFYSTTMTMAPAAGALTVNVFRLNSVFDPDFTNVGTSVGGYTALAGLYNRYRVLSVKGHISFGNLGSSNLSCFLAVNSVNTVGTSINTALAQRHVWTKQLAANTGNGVVEHQFATPIHLIYGVPQAQVRNEDDFAAITGSNPNNVVYGHIGFYNYSGAASSALLTVRLEYDVVWSLPLEFTQP